MFELLNLPLLLLPFLLKGLHNASQLSLDPVEQIVGD